MKKNNIVLFCCLCTLQSFITPPILASTNGITVSYPTNRTPPVKITSLFLDIPSEDALAFNVSMDASTLTYDIDNDSALPPGNNGCFINATTNSCDYEISISEVKRYTDEQPYRRLKVSITAQDEDSCSPVDTVGAISIHSNRDVSGACINSFEIVDDTDLSCPVGKITAGDSPAAITSPVTPSFTVCDELDAAGNSWIDRPAVDVMLVLDKSGSMGSGGKIEALRSAVNNFVDQWAQSGVLKTDSDAAKADRLGVVLFNGDASDWTFSDSEENLTEGLNKFTPKLRSAISGKTDTILPGGMTSIGDGLFQAASYLTATNKRQVILLMSDGKETAARRVTADGTSIIIGGDELNLDNLNIWVVSIGNSATDINATVLENIAKAGKGFYINTTVGESSDLNLYFLELLQNFLRFNTIETTRLISEKMSINRLSSVGGIGTTRFKVATSSTAKMVSFSLMWNPQINADISMTVTPPKGDPIDPSHFQKGKGFIRMTLPLPLPDGYPAGSHTGEWSIGISAKGHGLSSKFPYQFYALTDDDEIKSTFDIGNKDYVTGEAIPLRVKLTEFSSPILNQDGKLKVIATLVKPEDGIGNLLAKNSVTGTPPPNTGDTLSPTDQKLAALLQENPDLIKSLSDVIELFDDGKPEHGDKTKNDGIYSALYTETEKQGHYNFLFAVSGPTKYTGLLSRQQIKTVYVRLAPDADETTISSEITDNGADGQTLTVTMTPRDKYGNHFGPGYQNHFLVSPVFGHRYKFQDNDLNGIYEMNIHIPKDKQPPLIDIQYVKPFMVITDEMDPEKIPTDLAETFTKYEPPCEKCGETEEWQKTLIYFSFFILILVALGFFLRNRRP